MRHDCFRGSWLKPLTHSSLCIWQQGRDSNPRLRFWRPLFCQLNYPASLLKLTRSLRRQLVNANENLLWYSIEIYFGIGFEKFWRRRQDSNLCGERVTNCLAGSPLNPLGHASAESIEGPTRYAGHFCAPWRGAMSASIGAKDWSRTSDAYLFRVPLYQLSYRGVERGCQACARAP